MTDVITVAVNVTLKLDVPTDDIDNADALLARAAIIGRGVVEEALGKAYPERRPGWYQWASHHCGRPGSRCVSVEAATPLADREAIEAMVAMLREEN